MAVRPSRVAAGACRVGVLAGASEELGAVSEGPGRRAPARAFPVGIPRGVSRAKSRGNVVKMPHGHDFCMEPAPGIEPALSAWEADVLPLNYVGAMQIVHRCKA